MTTLYNEDGEEVEAFTADEVKTKNKEAVDLAIEKLAGTRDEEFKDLEEKLTQAEKDKADLQEKLEKGGDKEINFKNLREKEALKDKQIEELKSQIETFGKDTTKQIEDLKQNIGQQTIDKQILDACGGDKDLAAKARITYGKFAGTPQTPEEVNQRIQDSLTLLTGKPQKMLDHNVFGGGSGSGITHKVQGKISDDAVSVAKSLGLSDQEMKKAGLI